MTSGTTGNDIMVGTSGPDILDGLAGNDLLLGLGGNDTLNGGDGDDAIYPGAGSDAIDGGAGWDYLFYAGAAGNVLVDLVNPGLNTGDAAGDTYSGIEVLIGGDFADDLRGDAQANLIYGGAGNDYLYGREGDDSLIGGDGNDVLIGGPGRDRLYGGVGDDMLYPGDSRDYPSAGAGKHIVDGGDGYDFVNYSNLVIGIYANLGSNGSTIYQGDVLDTGDAYANVEGLIGTQLKDILIGTGGDSWIYGLGGDDVIDAGYNPFGLSGVHFFGGDGNDTLQGGGGDDWIYGDAGDDTIRTYSGDDHAFGGAGNDKFEVTGDPFRDWFDGGDGNDTFLIWSDGAFGGDNYIGGAGIDSIDLSLFGLSNNTGAVVDLVDWYAATGQLGGATYDGIENVYGSQYNDSLRGNALDNVLSGGNGIDWLYGRGGNDTLLGGDGADTLFGNDGDDVLTGGAGIDRFYFGAGDGKDRITDFLAGYDQVFLGTALGVASFADVQAKAVQSGSDVLITFNAATTLTLVGVQLSALTAGDFQFYT